MSAAPKHAKKLNKQEASDENSDNSGDTSSLDSQKIQVYIGDETLSPPSSSRKKGEKRSRQKPQAEWEILEGLRNDQKCEEKPSKYEGFLLKRRKWPMKGWHKRYFALESGLLTYAKSPSDILKGKIHGAIDIGLSVVAFKKSSGRFDIDAEELIYHLKVKNRNQFEEWLSKFRVHRLYRQHEIAYGTKDVPKLTDIMSSPVEEIEANDVVRGDLTRTLSISREPNFRSRRSSSFMASGGSNPGRVATWLMDTAGIERCNKELMSAQSNIFRLNELIQALELSVLAQVEPPTPEKLKPRRSLMRRRRKNQSGNVGGNVSGNGASHYLLLSDRRMSCSAASEYDRSGSGGGASSGADESGAPIWLTQSGGLQLTNGSLHISSSNPNLMASDVDRQRPVSVHDYPAIWRSAPDSTKENASRKEFINVARSVHDTMKSLVRIVTTERERLKGAIEQESLQATTPGYVHSLRMALTDAIRQNSDLRNKLSRIHADSNLVDIPEPSPTVRIELPSSRLTHSLSGESTSICEFYDAQDSLSVRGAESDVSASPTSSDIDDIDEDDEDIESDISEQSEDFDTEYSAHRFESLTSVKNRTQTGRRSTLPAPRPDTSDVSLWNILRKNVGKDLSKISMPVHLNEPLNYLQKLCEDLEYSDLLDRAASCDDPYERMVYVAAFSVSGYACSLTRAGQKPFNPVLGETYECIREDMGWRFISEQVSHHPPISACHCESRNFIYWQDMRIKNKFWGKSMEIQPLGAVHLVFPKWHEHYTWNKITTCVHDIFNSQRYPDLYGESVIKCGGVTCRLTFDKASYWSNKRHEVHGDVYGPDGESVRNIFGKWSEGIYCGHSSTAKCVWRPGTLPDNNELYYGFTRFATELNELPPDLVNQLPGTDTRFRPDQRNLEEGHIQEAEQAKVNVEQMQRDARRKREEQGVTYEPMWFRKLPGEDAYEYKCTYWEARKNPGFGKVSLPKLW